MASRQHANIEASDNENALVDGEKIASVMQIIEHGSILSCCGFVI